MRVTGRSSQAGMTNPFFNQVVRGSVFPQDRHATMPECVQTCRRVPEFSKNLVELPPYVTFAEWRAITSLKNASTRATCQVLCQHLDQNRINFYLSVCLLGFSRHLPAVPYAPANEYPTCRKIKVLNMQPE